MLSTNEKKGDIRKDQIKKAALKVFAAKGISGTRMSMIAEEAGISQGLTYRYFKSKEVLFTTLIQEALEESRVAMLNASLIPGSPKEQIKIMTKTILDESNKLPFMLIQQANTTSEGVPENVKEMLKEYSLSNPIDSLVPIVIKGQEMGEFCEGDPKQLLLFYFSIITGLMLQDLSVIDNSQEYHVELLGKILTK
ncbi:TetR/AcrR family transcriptional regulator [Fictibacillus sp. 5RED26]|uniref:TetR/AcrR family transcriptional regulator n=1 Tax=Fictibacillus sp. 5RED26 TaxID=2745876 RepID=UPI001E3B5B98|nr:TetR/AcrR family transcriptional regulator [Fictibacillus sp. 5RED26]